MSVSLISCLLLFTVGVYSASVPKCHLETLEVCGEPLNEFRRESGQKFPTTEDQVKALCTKLNEAKDCVNNFKKQCMTPMQLQLASFLTEGAHTVFEEFCTSGTDIRNDYLEHAECINEAYNSDEFKDVASYVEAGLEQINEKPTKERLPTACCGYQWLDKNMKRLGTEKCGADAVEAFQRVTAMAVSNLPDILCQGYEPESDECSSVLPPAGTKPSGNLRKSELAKSFSAMYLDN